MQFGKQAPAQQPLVRTALEKHFGRQPLHELVTGVREYPIHTRLDLQNALYEVLSDQLAPRKLFGLHPQSHHSFDTLAFANLLSVHAHDGVSIAPLCYEEIDIGETLPARCLHNALWLCADKDLAFCVLLGRVRKTMREGGLHLEIAVAPGEAGVELTRRLFLRLERKVAQAGSYRGKVLSLEADTASRGSRVVKVHRLPLVRRDEVILPEKTLGLLERNVARFIEHRAALNAMRLGVKKGLLFYGPPGTGKTHTIRYLASQMKDHTTLLITSDQVALLDEYIQLARFLQPSMVVIEDADLIARSRGAMRNSCEETMLNRLLNEMDGLREDAQILFVLTTNHPEQLEQALTARPGRIDQAIEFPLPDDDGRRKLIVLYCGSLKLNDELLSLLIQKTNGGSGAFIKELMRRSAQYLVDSKETVLAAPHVEAALDEMLFSGGSLNAKLLGFSKLGFTSRS